MNRPLCVVCGAYWDCGHPICEIAGLPVYLDEEQEPPVIFWHLGPPTPEHIAKVEAAMKVLMPEFGGKA